MGRTRQVNERGIGLSSGEGGFKLKDIRVYDEAGRVEVWVEINVRGPIDCGTAESMQYLSPEEAMAFAKAFERCAIQALKDSA